MEHVGHFFITTSLGPYDNMLLERLDRFMSEPVEVAEWLLLIYDESAALQSPIYPTG